MTIKFQTNGIRFKILRLIQESKPKYCFKHQTKSSKCEGGSREYHKNKASSFGNLDLETEDDKNDYENIQKDLIFFK